MTRRNEPSRLEFVDEYPIVYWLRMPPAIIRRFQSGYLPAPAVGNRDVEDDQIDIDSDSILPSVPVLLNRDGGS